MKLSWTQLTSLPNHILEKEVEEVEVVYKESVSSKAIKDRKPLTGAGLFKRKKGEFSETLSQEEEWLSETSQGQLVVDIYDDEENNVLVLQSTIAGVKSEALDITVEPDLIVIRGKREKKRTEKSRHYYYSECFWGNFSRTLVLPVRILPDKVKATLKNGILTVVLPKADEDKGSESVEVKS